MLSMVLYFILALLLLVAVHEYGHFLVARWCGVKVLRFSFGFGKVLARWRDKRGTEFTWSLIPLGGYLQMLDEENGLVPEEERHLAFNNKSVWARIAIVVAGPLFNFIFAFVALWLVLVIGITSLAPVIDSVKPGSIAANAGLTKQQEILSINANKINSWRDVQYALALLTGTHDDVTMTVKSLINHKQSTHVLSGTMWELEANTPDVLMSLGLVPFIPVIPPIVGQVISDTPAQAAGLHSGDVVTSANKKPINDWVSLVHFIKKHPNAHIVLGINRDGQPMLLPIYVSSVVNKGITEGFLGVKSKKINMVGHWFRVNRAAPLQAVGMAFKQTMDLTSATFATIGRLLTGNLPWQSISGPVGIAQGAGESANSGIAYYLFFLALVSISLGVMNLLPIPMLDGGHLIYYLIEIISRRPVSNGIKSISAYFGLGLLVMLTIVALNNDLTRLAGS